MPGTSKIEKFSPNELANLRGDLMVSGLDSWQAAAVVSSFLAGRGYGMNAEHVPYAITRLEAPGCSQEHMQEALERIALVM